MPDDETLKRGLNVLDALYDAKGQEAANEVGKRPRTPERQAQVEAMLARGREALRKARQRAVAERLKERQPEPTRPVPPRILAMTRDAIIERLRALIETPDDAGLQPVIQFRDLEELSTSDLQRILADLEEQLGPDPD